MMTFRTMSIHAAYHSEIIDFILESHLTSTGVALRACEILRLNSYSNAGFNLVSAKAYDDNLEAIGSGVLQHEAGLGPFELISSDVIYETLSAPCQTQAGCWMVVQY